MEATVRKVAGEELKIAAEDGKEELLRDGKQGEVELAVRRWN